jgi:hypothetical protein
VGTDIEMDDDSNSPELRTPELRAEEYAGKWLNKIELSNKEEKKWREDAEKICDIYVPPTNKRTSDFNILYSNTEIMLPSLYSQTPKADVRRRYAEKDPVSRVAALGLERCLDYELDEYDFDYVIECCVLDSLLPGRGIARVRYEPQMQEMQTLDGQTFEQIVHESVICEYVKWRDFRRSPGKVWADVTWIAFRNRLTKKQVAVLSPELVDKLEFDYIADDSDKESNKNETDAEKAEKRLTVWEIWDKTNKQVIFIAPSYKDSVLLQTPDPLQLDGFFPIPRPLQFILNTNSLVPAPEYRQYEKQARELEELSRRIIYITKALKLRGVYDSTMKELALLLDAEDNEMIPAENVAGMYEKGGIEKMVWIMPIQDAASVLRELYGQRELAKQAVYDISGISDVMRGQTKASETLGAQQLKANFGSTRLRRKQRELQRFIRDLIRLKAEIIAEHFQPETIAKIANITPEDLIDGAAPPTAPGQPPAPPPMVKPEDVIALLQNDELRNYRIGIQTDSTIAEEDAEKQAAMSTFLQGMNQFFAMITPAVQAGWLPIDAAKKLLSAVSRKFKVGEDFEAALEAMREPPEKPDPQIEVDKADLAIKDKQVTGELELGKQELQLDGMKALGEYQVKMKEADNAANQPQTFPR